MFQVLPARVSPVRGYNSVNSAEILCRKILASSSQWTLVALKLRGVTALAIHQMGDISHILQRIGGVVYRLSVSCLQ